MNNKISRKLLVACCLAFITLPAMAQKSKQALFDAFAEFTSKLVKDKQTTQVISNTYSDGYIQEYHFKAPVAIVQKFDETMMSQAQPAYISFMKTAGTSSLKDTGASIAYGENNKESRRISYDRDCNYNLQFFHDTKDKTKRYAYVLAWKKDGDKAAGYVMKIYGKNPQMYTTGIEETKIIEKPTNSQEFMQSFSNLRSLYVDQNDKLGKDLVYVRVYGQKSSDKLPLLTGIVNKITALCNNYGNVLKTADYKLVRDTLKEMQQQANDKYVGKLLGVCYENLGNINPLP